MKKIFLFFILNLAVFAAGCSNTSNWNTSKKTENTKIIQPVTTEKSAVKKYPLSSVLISETDCDVDEDKEEEVIQIILDQGNFNEDRELWAGGGPKWIGKFSLQVIKGSKILSSQSLNALMNAEASDEEIFLYAPEFKLPLKDYNDDGLMDFNIGQYFSSNGFEYKLFTINKDGFVKNLPFENKQSLFISSRGNSIELNSENGNIKIPYYDNSKGAYCTDLYIWDSVSGIFKLTSHEEKKD